MTPDKMTLRAVLTPTSSPCLFVQSPLFFSNEEEFIGKKTYGFYKKILFFPLCDSYLKWFVTLIELPAKKDLS